MLVDCGALVDVGFGVFVADGKLVGMELGTCVDVGSAVGTVEGTAVLVRVAVGKAVDVRVAVAVGRGVDVRVGVAVGGTLVGVGGGRLRWLGCRLRGCPGPALLPTSTVNQAWPLAPEAIGHPEVSINRVHQDDPMGCEFFQPVTMSWAVG